MKAEMLEKVLYRLEIIESFMMDENVLIFKENDDIYLPCIAEEITVTRYSDLT